MPRKISFKGAAMGAGSKEPTSTSSQLSDTPRNTPRQTPQQQPPRPAPTAVASLALGASSSLFALIVWGGFTYLRRGSYNPADAIVTLGVFLSIPLSVSCSIAALVLAAIAKLRRPSNQKQLETMKRDRAMTGTAMSLSLLPSLTFIVLTIGPP
jgi:hypothetical protein